MYSAYDNLLNYFYPCQKLLSRERVGSKVKKACDKPKTPFDRAVWDDELSKALKDSLIARKESLDLMSEMTIMNKAFSCTIAEKPVLLNSTTGRIMGTLPQEQEEHFFTYADYKEWELDEGERFELINGEAYAMSGPNTRHQEILGELFSQFHNYLQGKPCKVYPEVMIKVCGYLV